MDRTFLPIHNNEQPPRTWRARSRLAALAGRQRRLHSTSRAASSFPLAFPTTPSTPRVFVVLPHDPPGPAPPPARPLVHIPTTHVPHATPLSPYFKTKTDRLIPPHPAEHLARPLLLLEPRALPRAHRNDGVRVARLDRAHRARRPRAPRRHEQGPPAACADDGRVGRHRVDWKGEGVESGDGLIGVGLGAGCGIGV